MDCTKCDILNYIDIYKYIFVWFKNECIYLILVLTFAVRDKQCL